MKTYFTDKEINYSGAELRSHWLRDYFGLEGDAIAGFVGICNVDPEHMVDLEDLEAGASIYSEEMLHFIIEHFDVELKDIALRQRILICIIKETLEDMNESLKLKRSGDDLFEEDAKLTVSIATKSPGSGLIHAGINVSSKNTPVKTKGLKDYDINPKIFGTEILKRYEEEIKSLGRAISKVKWVG